MAKRTLYLHIGYPKTGTTTLQQSFFNNIKKDRFFYAGTANKSDNFTATQSAQHLNEAFFEYVVNNKTSELRDLESYLGEADQVLISREGVTSSLVSIDDTEPKIALPEMTQRLRSFADAISADEVIILIMLRRQDEFAQSIFCQSHRHSFDNVFDKFVGRICNVKNLHSQAFKYNEVIDALSAEFGRNSVKTFCYEHFSESPSEFLRKLINIFDLNNMADDYSLFNANERHVAPDIKRARGYGLVDVLASIKKKLGLRIGSGLGKKLLFLNTIKIGQRKIEISKNQRFNIMETFRPYNKMLAEVVDDFERPDYFKD